MSLSRTSRPPPEVVVYCNPVKRQEASSSNKKTKSTSKNAQNQNGVDLLRKARREVYNLGMSGFGKEKKEESRIALAVKLGAKPPKNKYYNYKEFINLRQVKKKEERIQQIKAREMGLQVKKPVQPPAKKKRDIRGFTGQVGRFKGGVLSIPSRVIKSTSRHKK